ncbi:MAG: hypothetical protein KDA25_12630, partial [Phycisphaerales bacterium]|nr:hypothetical protein [Phycisphaerales bacterium]
MRGRTYGCGLVLAIGLNAGVGHAGSGEVWGLKSQGSFAAPPTHLFRFHADGTDFIDVGAVQIGGEDVVLDGLAITADGTLHAFELLASGSRHVVIDPDTLVA